MTGLAIAEASARTGLSIDTLRYYEKAGLVTPPPRDAGGRRVYSENDVEWLVFVTRLRSTGMPIRRIQEYAALRTGGAATARQRKEILVEHRAVIRAQLDALTENLENLEFKIAHYETIESQLDELDGVRGIA
jgi:DNA-binding transcriptional MerR regulator